MKHIYLLILFFFISTTVFGQGSIKPDSLVVKPENTDTLKAKPPIQKPGVDNPQIISVNKPLGVVDSTTTATNIKLDKLTELVKKLDEKISDNEGLVAGILRVAYGVKFDPCPDPTAKPNEPSIDFSYLYTDILDNYDKIYAHMGEIEKLFKEEKWQKIKEIIDEINLIVVKITKTNSDIATLFKEKTYQQYYKNIQATDTLSIYINKEIEEIFKDKKDIKSIKELNISKLKTIISNNEKEDLAEQVNNLKSAAKGPQPCDALTNPLAHIKNIHVEIKDGLLYDIEVTTQDGKKFTNRRAPIEVSEISGRRINEKLYNGNWTQYIELSDILQYDRKTYIGPDDAIFDFRNNEDTLILRRNTNINNIIEVRLYSDVLGTFFNAKNAIASMEFFWKHELNLVNVNNVNMHFIKYGVFNVAGSRLDNDYKTYNYDTLRYTRLGLNQRSYLTMSYTLNFLNFWWPPRPKGQNSFSINFLVGGNISQMKDTINFKGSEDSIRTVFMPYIGFNIKPLVYKLQDRIYIDAGVSFYWQYAPTLRTPENFVPNNAYRAVPYIVPEVNFIWSPGGASSKLFFRGRYFTSTFQSDMKDSYFQLQVGYSQSITELIKKVKNGD